MKKQCRRRAEPFLALFGTDTFQTADWILDQRGAMLCESLLLDKLAIAVLAIVFRTRVNCSVHFVGQILIQGLFIDKIVIAIATTKMRGMMYGGAAMLAESFSINKETVAVLAKTMTCAKLVLFDSIFAPKPLVTFWTKLMHLRPLVLTKRSIVAKAAATCALSHNGTDPGL